MFKEDDFFSFFGYSKSTLDELIFQYSKNRSKKFCLSSEKEVIMGAIFIRHYIDINVLSVFFQVPKTTCRDICERVRIFYLKYFSKYVIFPNYNERHSQSIICSGKKIVAIIDGTEQPVPKSQQLTLNAKFYSSKKKQHSINILILVSPRGKIYSISNSEGGRIVDSTMAGCMLPKFINRFTETEFILGDSGFTGVSDFIIIPEEFSNKQDFTSIRIKVENTIGWIKNFKLCSHKLKKKCTNPEILNYHNDNFKLVCGIINYNLDNGYYNYICTPAYK